MEAISPMYDPRRYFHEAGGRKIKAFRSSIESFTIYYSVYPSNLPVHARTHTNAKALYQDFIANIGFVVAGA